MKDKIVIKSNFIKKYRPKNPKVGISDEHYDFLCSIAEKTGRTCSEINNMFYDYIRKNAEIVIEGSI
jgi:hypothetical protein